MFNCWGGSSRLMTCMCWHMNQPHVSLPIKLLYFWITRRDVWVFFFFSPGGFGSNEGNNTFGRFGPNGGVFSRRWAALSHLYKIIRVSPLKEWWRAFFKIRQLCNPRMNTVQGQMLQHLEEVLGATGDLETLALHGEAKLCINNTQCLKNQVKCLCSGEMSTFCTH